MPKSTLCSAPDTVLYFYTCTCAWLCPLIPVYLLFIVYIICLLFHNRPESAYTSSVTTSCTRVSEEPGGGVKTTFVWADQSLDQLLLLFMLLSSRYYYFYCYCCYYYYYTSTNACVPVDAKEYVDIRGTRRR